VNAAPSTTEQRVVQVRARIDRAAERAGRNPNEITLIAVSKTHPAPSVVEVARTGISEFGENRVQEGVAKAAELAGLANVPQPTWHLIVHLQTNKVRAALGTFGILHSVDSERLARAISGAATTPVRIMIEVNVATEPQKYGVSAAELPALVETTRTLPNIELLGLMTVAPHVSDVEETRPIFRSLKQLADQSGLAALSMGMTNDFEVAIEEGATHVRIGRALFGDRA
jgi:pyridoxal phosphate enzyme (YggS family)